MFPCCRNQVLKLSVSSWAFLEGDRSSQCWKQSINQLVPFLDKDGVLRVGGRLVKSNLSHELNLRGSICQQKMADLPKERLSQDPPLILL